MAKVPHVSTNFSETGIQDRYLEVVLVVVVVVVVFVVVMSTWWCL